MTAIHVRKLVKNCGVGRVQGVSSCPVGVGSGAPEKFSIPSFEMLKVYAFWTRAGTYYSNCNHDFTSYYFCIFRRKKCGPCGCAPAQLIATSLSRWHSLKAATHTSELVGN